MLRNQHDSRGIPDHSGIERHSPLARLTSGLRLLGDWATASRRRRICAAGIYHSNTNYHYFIGLWPVHKYIFLTCPNMPDVSSFLLVGFLLIGNSIWWFYVVIRLFRGYTNLSFSLCVNILPGKTQRWLCGPYCGYTSHVVVKRGYTWL